MALGLSKLNVKVWMQIMNCNIGPPTRVIDDQNSFWKMKHRLLPNVKLHYIYIYIWLKHYTYIYISIYCWLLINGYELYIQPW